MAGPGPSAGLSVNTPPESVSVLADEVLARLPLAVAKVNVLPLEIVAAAPPLSFSWLLITSGPPALIAAPPGRLKSAVPTADAGSQVDRAAGDRQTGHRAAATDVQQAGRDVDDGARGDVHGTIQVSGACQGARDVQARPALVVALLPSCNWLPPATLTVPLPVQAPLTVMLPEPAKERALPLFETGP